MLLMSAALATALFVATVLVREYKISKEVTDSLKAVYMADSAMEYTLYKMRVPTPSDTTGLMQGSFVFTAAESTSGFSTSTNPYMFNLPSSICYSAVGYVSNANGLGCRMDVLLDYSKTLNAPGCPSSSTAPSCTKVVTKGSFGGTNRAIELVYENL